MWYDYKPDYGAILIPEDIYNDIKIKHTPYDVDMKKYVIPPEMRDLGVKRLGGRVYAHREVYREADRIAYRDDPTSMG